MSIITLAARKQWIDSESPLSYKEFIFNMKANGFYWSASDE
jgi:hypothetical protein